MHSLLLIASLREKQCATKEDLEWYGAQKKTEKLRWTTYKWLDGIVWIKKKCLINLFDKCQRKDKKKNMTSWGRIKLRKWVNKINVIFFSSWLDYLKINCFFNFFLSFFCCFLCFTRNFIKFRFSFFSYISSSFRC